MQNRPEQLNIQEDPFYFPEIHLNFDLAAFGIPSEYSSGTAATSPRSLPSTQSSLQVGYGEGFEEGEGYGEEAGLDIPSYSTPGGVSGFESGPGTSFHAGSASNLQGSSYLFEDEPLVLDDPVFDLGDDGFLHPVTSADLQDEDEAGIEPLAAHGVDVAGGDNYHRGLSLDDHFQFDDDIIMFEDSEPAVQPSDAPVTPQPAGTKGQQDQRATSLTETVGEQSETAEAPQQRVRQAKPLRPDQRTELSNRDLSDWNQNYLANMEDALRAKQNKSHREARKNAEFWAMQQGIGNIATNFGADREPHPLAMFSGQSLWDLLKGVPTRVKRTRSGSATDEDEDDEEARRVRARTAFDEGVARGYDGDGDGFVFGGDDVPMFPSDNLNLESEVGRHAPSSLPDRSSGMPWNVSTSRHSSAQPLGSGLVARLSSSVGGLPGGMELGPPSAFGRRGSRLTSASPLLGRGSSVSRIGSPSHLTSNEDEFADLDAQLGLGTDMDFELYGPAADVDTQTAQQSSWIAMALENEANNFLSFVKTKMHEQPREQEEADENTSMRNKITFGELLPPTQNSYIVGAQGLLHVLALVTRGLLAVTQDNPFGDIEITVVKFP